MKISQTTDYAQCMITYRYLSLFSIHVVLFNAGSKIVDLTYSNLLQAKTRQSSIAKKFSFQIKDEMLPLTRPLQAKIVRTEL